MSNRVYDVLKWVAQYLLPALGTLYFVLAGTWNLPYGEEVVGTITAVDTFLGVVLGISTAQYTLCWMGYSRTPKALPVIFFLVKAECPSLMKHSGIRSKWLVRKRKSHTRGNTCSVIPLRRTATIEDAMLRFCQNFSDTPM